MRLPFPLFCRLLVPEFLEPPHMKVLLGEYQSFAERQPTHARVMIEAPVRHGKSFLGSQLLPAYLLGEHPGAQVMLLTHGDTLSNYFGRSIRALLRSPRFRAVYDTEPVKGSDTAKLVQLTNGSTLHCLSRGGAGVGLGADFLIADDLFKNADEARSPTHRRNIYEWWHSVAQARRQSEDSPVLIINTRWHLDDLCGRLLEAEGDRWKRVTMKALAEKPEEWKMYNGKRFTRETGEALWPDRFSRSALLEQRKVNPLFEALYQQSPTASEGGIFRRSDWGVYPDGVEYGISLLSLDTAIKTGEENDYTVITALGVTDGHVDVRDVYRGRWSYTATLGRVYHAYRKYRPGFVVVEDHGRGTDVAAHVREKLPDVVVVPVVKTRDKVSYAHGVAHVVRGNRVRLPRDADWLKAWVDEHAQFPTGTHDDQVDTLTQALKWLEDSGLMTPPEDSDFFILGT